MRGRKRYVGFYWTRPAPQVGFISLPDDADAAAAISRTIRYQREHVRRWVKDEKGELVAERVVLDVSPDRDTDAIVDDVRRVADIARANRAAVAIVGFSASANWRPHHPMRDALQAAGAEVAFIYPEPIMIDGAMFDPIAHFRAWQAFYEKTTAEKPALKAAILAHVEHHGPSDATWSEIAAWLNAEGYRTLNGKAWTTENVRKFLKA